MTVILALVVIHKLISKARRRSQNDSNPNDPRATSEISSDALPRVDAVESVEAGVYSGEQGSMAQGNTSRYTHGGSKEEMACTAEINISNECVHL